MTTRQVDPVAPEILPGRLPAQAELKQPGVAAIVDLCAELPCPTPRLRAAVVAMLDPDLPFGAGAGAALAWPRLCFAAEGAHTAGRPVSSAPHEFFANDLPQVGFEVTAFDDAAKGIVDDRLLATLTSQRLEMFDDWRVEHDVDPQLADALAHCGLPLGAADLPAGGIGVRSSLLPRTASSRLKATCRRQRERAGLHGARGRTGSPPPWTSLERRGAAP